MRKKIKKWFKENPQEKLKCDSRKTYRILLNYENLNRKHLEVIEVGKYNRAITLGVTLFDSKDMAQKFINDLGEQELIKYYGKQIQEEIE